MLDDKQKCSRHRRRAWLVVSACLVVGMGALAWSQIASDADSGLELIEDPLVKNKLEQNVSSVLDFTVKSIDGEDVQLDEYRGKVLLIVNVASRCGFTPQYKGLQELFEKYGDRGLVVLGFPCNQFMGQEPGTEAEIKEFCSTRYHVQFPMFAKIDVKGRGQAPLYKYLTSQDAKPKGAGNVSWNFEKFLIDRNGQVVARFNMRTKPDAPVLIGAIESALDDQAG